MRTVVVEGFPKKANKTVVILQLKKILSKDGIKKFWIQEFEDYKEMESKKAFIEFQDDDATTAQRVLNNHLYVFKGSRFPLFAKVYENNRTPSPGQISGSTRMYSPDQDPLDDDIYDWFSNGNSSRSRSSSPNIDYSSDVSKLDKEIELIRKQRMVIEEKTKLLLECEKLEQLKEYHYAALNINEEIESVNRSHSYERSLSFDERSLETRKRRVTPQKMHQKSPYPRFILPCRKLLQSMKKHINRLAFPEEIMDLNNLIRSEIRSRLAICLQGKDYMQTAKIMLLYRNLHPLNTDENLVINLLNKLRKGKSGGKSEDSESGTVKDKSNGFDLMESFISQQVGQRHGEYTAGGYILGADWTEDIQ